MERLTWKDDLGYGYASMADSISYSFVGTFFMFFATTVAGVRPAVAGLMTAIGAIWNALYNPFMGILSDGLFTRRGRRRPFLRAMIIPLPLALVLLFTNMPLPEPLKSHPHRLLRPKKAPPEHPHLQEARTLFRRVQ